MGMFDDSKYVDNLRREKANLTRTIVTDFMNRILPAAHDGNVDLVKEIVGELPNEDQEIVWGHIGSTDRALIKKLLKG